MQQAAETTTPPVATITPVSMPVWASTVTMTTVDTDFEAAFKASRNVDKEGGKVWDGVVKFAQTSKLMFMVDEKHRKARFEEEEERVETAHKQSPKEFGAYRTAKSVCLSAIKYKVALFDGEGKVRGKTAVEKDLKAAKASEKPAIDKWQATFNSLNSLTNDLEGLEDLNVAFTNIDALRNKLAEMVRNEMESKKLAA